MIKQVLTKIVESKILTVFCALVAIGIIGLIYDLFSLKMQKRFGKKYLSKYKQLRYSSTFDEKCYQWLLHKLDRMQTEMGEYGIIDHYKPAYSANVIPNYLEPVLKRNIVFKS